MLFEGQVHGSLAADTPAGNVGPQDTAFHRQRSGDDGLHGTHMLPDTPEQELVRTSCTIHSDLAGMLDIYTHSPVEIAVYES